jgi:predicted DNA-binding transcriptional regulator YafY
MPVNKLAYERYCIIDRCLREQHYPCVKKLLGAVADIQTVTRRTLYRDIDAMRYSDELSFHAPIQYCKRNKGYYYAVPNYSIHQIAYTREHQEALELATRLLQRYGGIHIMKPFEEIIGKFRSLSASRLHDDGVLEAIMPDIPLQIAGMEYLETFISAIRNHEVLHFTYTKYTEPPEIRYPHFHPYALKEYDNRWYAIGYTEERKELRTYGLDRVTDLVHCTENTYRTDPDFRAVNLFRNSIGITFDPNSPVLDITLKFTPQQGRYLISSPLHTSQRVLEQTRDYTLIGFGVIESYELKSKILSYGKSCEVVAPVSLKKAVEEMK